MLEFFGAFLLNKVGLEGFSMMIIEQHIERFVSDDRSVRYYSETYLQEFYKQFLKVGGYEVISQVCM